MSQVIRLLQSPTSKATALFYFGSFAVNLANYAFHFLLLKLITPPEYGEFSSYLSLLYLLTIPSSAISMVVTKQVADLYSNNRLEELNYFFYSIIKKIITFGIVICVLLVIFSPYLSSIIKVGQQSILILAVSILIVISSSIITAYLIGQQKLTNSVIIGLISSTAKIISAALLIVLGLRVLGAVSAIFISFLTTLVLGIYTLREQLFPPTNRTFSIPIKSLGSWSLVYSASSLSLISADILLVRHFFTSFESGVYAALITLSKTIYFGISPLILLIIPLVSSRQGKGQPTAKVLLGITFIAITLGAIAVTIFNTFPHQMISILAGSQYLSAINLLFPALLSIFLFTINLILINYFIALSRNQINIGLLISALIQPVSIYFFHSNLSSVISINICIQIFLTLWIAAFSLKSFVNVSRKN